MSSDNKFEAAYAFGAVCPAEGKAAALVMPKANSEGMQHYLDVIAAAVTSGKHAVLVVDRAAWHVIPIPINSYDNKAHFREQRVRMVSGCLANLFQAWQHTSTMSS